jgi:hypothetical protein
MHPGPAGFFHLLDHREELDRKYGQVRTALAAAFAANQLTGVDYAQIRGHLIRHVPQLTILLYCLIHLKPFACFCALFHINSGVYFKMRYG